jgi:hypothetical protein
MGLVALPVAKQVRDDDMEAILQGADVTSVPPTITPHRETVEQRQYGAAA